MTAFALQRRTLTAKGKSAFKKTLISFPVIPFETKTNINFKSFKLMLLLQCYCSITTSYSHDCKEMLSLISTFVHLKLIGAYIYDLVCPICLELSLQHACLFYTLDFKSCSTIKFFHPSSTGSLTDQYISLASKHSSRLTQDPTCPICSFFHVKHSQMSPFLLGLHTVTACSSWALPKDRASFYKL